MPTEPTELSPLQLMTAYRALEEPERTLLRLLAVSTQSLNRPQLLQCLQQLTVLSPKNRPYTQAGQLKPSLDRLIDAGLVHRVDNGPLACEEVILEDINRELLAEGRFETLAALIQKVDPWRETWGWTHFRSRNQALREIRIALYRGDMDTLSKHLNGFAQQFHDDYWLDNPLDAICNRPFDADWFGYLADESAQAALEIICRLDNFALEPVAGPLAYLQERCEQGDAPGGMKLFWAEQTLWTDGPGPALALWGDDDSPHAAALAGRLALAQGRSAEAVNCFKNAMKRLAKQAGSRQSRLPEPDGVFYVLALIAEGRLAPLSQAATYVDRGTMSPDFHYGLTYFNLLHFLKLLRQGNGDLSSLIDQTELKEGWVTLHDLFLGLLLYWSQAPEAGRVIPRLKKLQERARDGGYHWLTGEVTTLLARLGEPPAGPLPDHPLADLVRPKASWELALEALTARETASEAQPRENDLRLVWWLALSGDAEVTIEPREQKRTARGDWSRGRQLSLKRLWDRTINTPLTPQDQRVIGTLEHEPDPYYYGRGSYVFNPGQALAALVGHPLLFWADDPEVQVELVKGEPELRVLRAPEGLRLELWPQAAAGVDQVIILETPTRLRLIPLNQEHHRMQTILGKGLEVPPEAESRVREVVGSLAGRVTVHSDVGGSGALQAQEVPADSQPHLHLFPYGPGLRVQLRVVPFAQAAGDGDQGPAFAPGDGGATVIAKVGQQRLQARREADQERQRATRVVEACPALAGAEEGDWEWTLEEPGQCLELLAQAQQLEDVVVAWPEGEKFRISRPRDLDALNLAIRGSGNWFEVDGSLELEDGQVLEMQRLLALLRESPGRFLALGDNQFLTLTERFRRQLEELQSFGEGNGRYHPLTAPILEDLAGEAGSFKADQAWQEQLARLKGARELDPTPPSTLQAELRDYQREGYAWLTRLAHWGVGACLADDMGLGKTVQALAVILSRAPDGPTLVVAPTSVAANWQDEAARFAPTLKVVPFAESDRQRVLDEAGSFDLVIASYTLLQQEGEALARVKWQTIVLDEAQAIKNPATKRSQAAMALDGGFRIITTGTPVENHLGELWNLFRFINPGLLGSRERFNERFAGPIERHNDPLARNRLRRLIQPFILRRTKQQVLQELPGRTDIVLHVELDREELAFYEALRRQALEQLSRMDDAPAGHKHLQILAQITKLRRACCHPELVSPGVGLESSKLALFGEVLAELLDNRHKVLVFSQFVDHLTLIRRWLDQHKVHYQYLDGSTPAVERRNRVKAFQAGEGEVFLISLKAGGTGLNLTAADYVIHMDPWWNPAVEDQASDRAHRIGQQRPVTVYRLVTRHTIEEKIVALHQQKRDLAEGLLEGADMSGRMGADELMRLIREG